MSHTSASTAELAATSHVYSLLARLWLKEVDAPLIQLLRESDLGEAWRAAGGVIPSIDEIEELAAEYCRLFVGPKNHLAPFQSLWQDGQLQTRIASSVSQFADLLDYRVPPQYPATMIDHLGVQLDIMGHAIARLTDQHSSEPQALAEEVLREFHARHLVWADRLLSAGAERASSSFYRSMIGLTAEFLQSQRHLWLPE